MTLPSQSKVQRAGEVVLFVCGLLVILIGLIFLIVTRFG